MQTNKNMKSISMTTSHIYKSGITQFYKGDSIFHDEIDRSFHSYLSQYVISLYQNVCEGLTFNRIYEIMKERTLATFYLNKQKYLLDCQLNGLVPNELILEEIKKAILEMILKPDALEDLFKHWFRENEHMLNSKMSALNATILTADHTFKVWFY